MNGTEFSILDGGSATELVRLGHESINDDPLWSARLLHTNPDAVLQIHKNFLEHGSDIIETVSYQASVEGFKKHLDVTQEQAVQLIKNSVELARRACREISEDKKTAEGKVAGSVGPYGAVLCDGSEYTGTYVDDLSEQELINWHRPRVKALVEAGVDYIAIETMPSQKEAECVAKLIQTDFPQARCWVSFSCKDGERTCHGESFREAIESVVKYDQVVAVGTNCTDPQYITPLLKCIQPLSLQKSVIVKPNSGEKWTRGTGWYGKADCRRLNECAEEWIQCGARWLGGCCRVYPQDIKDLKDSVCRTLKPKKD